MSSSIDVPVKCFSPRFVTNKYNHKQYYVPCGHCAACELQKSYSWSHRVEDECKLHRFSIFFTLTYDNDHVPYFELFSDDLGDYLYTDNIYVNQVQTSLVYSENCYLNRVHFLENDKSSKLRVGFLSKYDIQCFVKRLRINIDRYYEKEENEDVSVRYFISGEYGPNTFRPHYHGIIWTDNERLACSLKELICKSWSLADRYQTEQNISFVESNAAQYVSAYCNGTHCLPNYLQLKETKPFHLCSKNPSIGFSESDEDEVLDSVDSGLCTLSRKDEVSKQTLDVEISPYMAYKLFPKCRNFDQLSIIQRVQIYSEDFELARRKVFEFGKRFGYTSLDYVKSLLKPFQKFFYGTLKIKDLMKKSYHIRAAALHYMSKTKKSLLDFLACVDRLYSHKAHVRLVNQIKCVQDLIFNQRFSDIRYFYPLNFIKSSPAYLGLSSEFYSLVPDFKNGCFHRDFTIRSRFLSWLHCYQDMMNCNFSPSARLFEFVYSASGKSFVDNVNSAIHRRTKFKSFNDSELSNYFLTN